MITPDIEVNKKVHHGTRPARRSNPAVYVATLKKKKNAQAPVLIGWRGEKLFAKGSRRTHTGVVEPLEKKIQPATATLKS